MAKMTRTEDHVLVLFGATGDLAKRMLLPGLYRLAARGLLPTRYRIIGSAPAAVALSDDGFRRHVRDAVTEISNLPLDDAVWANLEQRLFLAAADPGDPAPLVAAIGAAEQVIGTGAKRLYHLAVPPPAFPSVVAMLGATGLAGRASVIVEKPFGSDLAHVVRGQYDGYLQEPGVSPTSTTETFVALRVELDNWRWRGVPFLLRTGKCLAESRRVVTLGFHQPTLHMFEVDQRNLWSRGGDVLVIDFSDPGSIEAVFLAKEPGPTMRLGRATMTFHYEQSFASANGLAGYDRFILDAMVGDQSLFTDAESIERLWEISASFLEDPPLVDTYAKGSWGPSSIAKVAAPDRWHLPTPVR